MVRHDHIGVEKVMAKHVGVVLNSFHHDVCDDGLAHIRRSTPGLVQQAVHCHEGLSGFKGAFRENPIWRQTIVQTPSKKQTAALLSICAAVFASRRSYLSSLLSGLEFLAEEKPIRGIDCRPGVRPTKDTKD